MKSNGTDGLPSDKREIKIKISVIIPTYNRYELLQRALESVYTQTYVPEEVIIIDDGSTDETSDIQNQFPQAKYIYQNNAGVSSARNLGIKNSSNKWIAFLDSDDTWDKYKLEKQIEFHQKNPQIQMSYTDELWVRDAKEVKVPKKFKKYGGDIFDKCLSHCIIAPSAVLLHKNLLDSIGLFDENLEVCEDYDLWLRITSLYEIGLVDEKLITKYAGHDDQLSFKYWGMDRFRVVALEKLLRYEFPCKIWELDEIQGLEDTKTDEIKKTLSQKYSLLLKGAIKHDKIQEIKIYKKRLKEIDE